MSFKVQEGFYDSLHPLARYTSEFAGGHLFTVVDGHAGHTCAHAVNMLHADYITANLLPHHLLAPLHAALTRQSLPHAPPQVGRPFCILSKSMPSVVDLPFIYPRLT
ncbi:unnamed protein product [Hydatigera taeniaeformis]|uniref:PPM-type phosphatase domain-containing protein n=1 Tax=Hydatigena taeniaeformis TaxID=6205 RepID=A0A0R3WWC6_HYDTA|nr:unnamed protein product [Hydatigera taeniaeformis]